MTCRCCGREYRFDRGFPDLIVDERFDDPTTMQKIQYEECSNADLTLNYLLPLFRQLWPTRGCRLLSLGCGTGVDVDLLTREGFECVGIDCGNRAKVWERREQKSQLILANGKHLPFPDESFDGVFCGCVFPHVGVVGDSSKVTAQYQSERFRLAREIGRVLRSNGKVIVSSPNRLFPLDLFHGREEGSLRPKWNWPGEPFLLSAHDYARLFRPAGLTRVVPLPVRNYWGFIRSRHSLDGWILGLPVRTLFWIASQVRLLRASPINPWLVLLLEKTN
jgi:SAM-dependent methyltransferase